MSSLDNPPDGYLDAYKNLYALLKEVDEMYKLNSTTGYNDKNYMDSAMICNDNIGEMMDILESTIPEGLTIN